MERVGCGCSGLYLLGARRFAAIDVVVHIILKRLICLFVRSLSTVPDRCSLRLVCGCIVTTAAVSLIFVFYTPLLSVYLHPICFSIQKFC